MIQTDTIVIVVCALIGLGIYVMKKGSEHTKNTMIYSIIGSVLILGFFAVISNIKPSSNTNQSTDDSLTIIYLPDNQIMAF